MYKIKEMMFGTKEEFEYLKCSSCGCLQINDVPNNISRFYPDSYYSLKVNPELLFKKNKNSIKFYLKKIRDKYLLFHSNPIGLILSVLFPNHSLKKIINNYLSGIKIKKIVSEDSRILDVGCGKGELLFILREMGYRNCYGVDPFLSNDIVYENGLVVWKRTLFDITDEFDLIMLHHSFEHMQDPEKILMKIYKLLSFDGICLIRIPIVDCLAWENYRENWVQIDAPRHFFLHSRKSIEILAQKTGFFIKNTIFDSNEFQFWGSEKYMKGIPLTVDAKSDLKFTNKQINKFKKKAEALNKLGQGDQAVFYLSKKK